ncbi:hypothetical protein PHLGIDRAFT_129202 [Phlebiopsis gigantea 11061_1 CR5-6]|uniref:Heterokaryon incompatibility domain-containing protein n=1 Tax=Phlebiopsis gigantea (strain 11061_1 CR5-6) TaxID=745531 RepID=A0A0C3NJ55_PHLG1|nr:hypothetical protein PHLGIDRAFT_129202 [Phlebiopsis gigantea 11061_1 CR5-6]
MPRNNKSLRQRLAALIPHVHGGDCDQKSRFIWAQNDAALQERLKATPTPNALPTYVDDPTGTYYDTTFIHTFLLSDPHKRYTLPFSEPLAKTRIYRRAWEILPNAVANIPCQHVTPRELLGYLGTVLHRDLEYTHEVEECLQLFIDDGYDFGEIYGYLRPWAGDLRHAQDANSFPAILTAVVIYLRNRRIEDLQLRSSAIVDNRIINPKVPPRRIWDLYSNRVLPYYAMHPSFDQNKVPRLPDELWAVSHSWVDEPHRQYVITPINSGLWPVPIPRGTTLDDIRNELLILGAEFVWLDVLCLRQKDDRKMGDQEIRKREWKLDIPTIGHIYTESLHRAVVVYFNGLGLPFRDEPVDPNDHFHWCNRAWTLQEFPSYMLIPGGSAQKIGRVKVQREGFSASAWAKNPEFIRHFHDSLLLPRSWDVHMAQASPRSSTSHSGSQESLNSFSTQTTTTTELSSEFELRIFEPLTLRAISEKLRGRFASIPLDLICAITYPLSCPVLPIYDPDDNVEVAWTRLVQCLSDFVRTHLLFTDFDPEDMYSSWIPPWNQVQSGRGLRDVRLFSETEQSQDERLKFLDGTSSDNGFLNGLGGYYHTPFVIHGCHILLEKTPAGDVECFVQVPLAKSVQYGRYRVSEWGASLRHNEPYILVGVGTLRYWVVAREKGVRRIFNKRAPWLYKVTTLRMPDIPEDWDAVKAFKEVVEGCAQLVVF